MKYFVTLIILFQLVYLKAETIRIPFDYSTIQLGIDAASDGDTVLVADGVYENVSASINFNGKAIVLISENGPENCIIYRGGWVVKFNSGESYNSILSGFTITGGDPSPAILCYNSSPIIMNNIIVNNWSEYAEGVVSLNNSSARMINNIFYKNSGEGQCSGIICLNNTNAVIINNTLFGSEIGSIGTFVTGVLCDATSSAQITNCIFWNTGSNDFSNCTVTYSSFDKEIPGIGNLNVYPNFSDTTAYDFTLLSNSACIDAGTPDTTGLNLPDFDIIGNPRIGGNGIDMGAFEYNNPEGIATDIDKPKVIVYPNPANTQVTFQLPTNHRSSSFQIIDIYGKTIAELPYKNNQPNLVWDCKDISSGVYFYQTEIEGINYSGKIIID